MKISQEKIHTKFSTIVLTNKPDHTISSIVRVGIIVTKKIANAVGRNRIRRRIKSAFRMAIANPSCQHSNKDFLFISKPKASTLPFSDMVRELTSIITKSCQNCSQH